MIQPLTPVKYPAGCYHARWLLHYPTKRPVRCSRRCFETKEEAEAYGARVAERCNK